MMYLLLRVTRCCCMLLVQHDSAATENTLTSGNIDVQLDDQSHTDHQQVLRPVRPHTHTDRLQSAVMRTSVLCSSLNKIILFIVRSIYNNRTVALATGHG